LLKTTFRDGLDFAWRGESVLHLGGGNCRVKHGTGTIVMSIESGANLHVVNNLGHTVLNSAVKSYQRLGIITLLYNPCVDPGILNGMGETAIELVREEIKYGFVGRSILDDLSPCLRIKYPSDGSLVTSYYRAFSWSGQLQ